MSDSRQRLKSEKENKTGKITRRQAKAEHLEVLRQAMHCDCDVAFALTRCPPVGGERKCFRVYIQEFLHLRAVRIFQNTHQPVF
jgi:hypothetical protein